VDRPGETIVADGVTGLSHRARRSADGHATEPNFDALRLAAHIRRTELGLTLKDVAARANASESAITGALYGYHEGSVRTWFAIAHALDMTVNELAAALES